MDDASAIINQIREYTTAHDELRAATIWSYDVPLSGIKRKTVDAVVFGLNEREYPADRTIRERSDRPLEDHSLGTFRDGTSAEAVISKKKAEKWYSEIKSYIGERRPAVLGELC
jgi:hypothetical protein